MSPQDPPKRLLFVDDDPGIRETMPSILKMQGFDVVTAATVAEALQAIAERRFDVLISDLNIGHPGDGFMVVHAMRQRHPECVTFILTGYPAFETALQAIRSQVDDYLIKPASPTVLIAAIEEKLNIGKRTFLVAGRDAENRVKSATRNGQSMQCEYNANGRRVRKTLGGSAITDFVCDLSGSAITELSGSGAWIRGEVHSAGRHLATYYSGTTYFVHADWLGTERVRTLPNGGVSETCKSLPFGDGQACAGTEASTRHFTGKERDTETGLDYFGARYYGSTMGRFSSPDPLGGHTEDPQTLNRYAYVRNNPLTLTDPTGLDFYLRCGDDSATCKDHHVGTTGEDGNFTATVVTSDSIRNGQNSATVDEEGVEVTTGGKTYHGEYFDNPASHTTDAKGNDVNHNPIELDGKAGSLLGQFTFNINGSNPKGGVWASGSFYFHGTGGDMRKALEKGFSYYGGLENAYGNPHHPGMLNFRFSMHPWEAQVENVGPSSHLLIPEKAPKYTVPQIGRPGGEFHVDSLTGWAHKNCANGTGPC